jgi:hypothetical protein
MNSSCRKPSNSAAFQLEASPCRHSPRAISSRAACFYGSMQILEQVNELLIEFNLDVTHDAVRLSCSNETVST